MLIVILISTILLDISGIAFSLLYLWLNIFSKYTDLDERNKSILKIAKTTMVLSMIFALLSCLLANNLNVASNIARTSLLYAVIAISWLVVLLACGGAMLYRNLSKKEFSSEIGQTTKQIFVIALPGAIIGFVLSWLFS